MILVLLALAIAPTVAIALYIYSQDKYEKEPLHILANCFLLGALTVIPVTLLLLLGDRLTSTSNDAIRTIVDAFVVAGFGEEFSKYLVLRHYTFNKAAFNEPFDGIVYSVMISLGFATVENIFEVLDGGLMVAVGRMFLAVPGHAADGVIMGYFVGLAKFTSGSRFRLLLCGLLAATCTHGLWDFWVFAIDGPFAIDPPVATALWLLTAVFVFLLAGGAIQRHQQASPFHPQAECLKLLAVVRAGDAEKVRALLAKGADPNAKAEAGLPEAGLPEAGVPMLGVAVSYRHRDVVEALLAAGAEVDAQTPSGETALKLASSLGRPDIADKIAARLKDRGPHVNVEAPDVAMVQLLLKYGASVNFKDRRKKMTPLHTAASHGRSDLVQLLIRQGADVNATDGLGQTPLHKAVEEAYTGTVQILLQHGADVNVVDRCESDTPLNLAMKRKEGRMFYRPNLQAFEETISLLRAHGAQ
ncbi:MAG: PrsW family glutamic-type intramembrane protease [Candidatus Methylomirabilales bacterium]